MAERYDPISCDVHDQLEAASVKKEEIELVFEDQGARQRERGLVSDVYTKDGAEFARLRNGDGERELRLDQIVEVHELHEKS